MTAYTKTGLVTNDVLHQADLEQVESQYDCAQQEFETGGWQLKKSLALDDDDAYDIGSLAARVKTLHAMLLRENKLHIREDFIGATLGSMWVLSGTGTPYFETRSGGNGAAALRTSDAALDSAFISFGEFTSLAPTLNIEFEVRSLEIYGIAGAEFWIGLYTDEENYCAFRAVSGEAHWQAETLENTNGNTLDTGVLVEEGVPHKFAIRFSAGHVKFEIDDIQVADFTTDVPTYPEEPYIGTICADEASAPSVMYFGRVEFWQDE